MYNYALTAFQSAKVSSIRFLIPLREETHYPVCPDVYVQPPSMLYPIAFPITDLRVHDSSDRYELSFLYSVELVTRSPESV